MAVGQLEELEELESGKCIGSAFMAFRDLKGIPYLLSARRLVPKYAPAVKICGFKKTPEASLGPWI